MEKRSEVDDRVVEALAGGGGSWCAAEEQEFRYTGSFSDPDGNVWQILCPDQLHVLT